MNHELLALLITLFTAALFGSWHCGAMCGPIAAALAARGPLWPYHVGRGLAYLSAGAVAGAFGQNLLFSESMALRGALALFLGSYFVLSFAGVISAAPTRGLPVLYRRLASPRRSALILGATSVLLPCGWLWTFLAAAAASGSAHAGLLVMSALWLNSLPALSAVHFYFRRGLGTLTPARDRWVRGLLALAGLYALGSHLFLKSW